MSHFQKLFLTCISKEGALTKRLTRLKFREWGLKNPESWTTCSRTQKARHDAIKVAAQHFCSKMDGAAGRMPTSVRSNISEIWQVAGQGHMRWRKVHRDVSLPLHKCLSAKPILGTVTLRAKTDINTCKNLQNLVCFTEYSVCTWYTTVYSVMWNDCFKIAETSNISKLSTLC